MLGAEQQSGALKKATDVFLEYKEQAGGPIDTDRAVGLCNEIFSASEGAKDLNLRLFGIRFVNHIFELSELFPRRDQVSAYGWSGLKDLFLRDPSDPDTVLAYALYHLNTGDRDRAKQLLCRLSRSALRHRDLAIKILDSLD